LLDERKAEQKGYEQHREQEEHHEVGQAPPNAISNFQALLTITPFMVRGALLRASHLEPSTIIPA